MADAPSEILRHRPVTSENSILMAGRKSEYTNRTKMQEIEVTDEDVTEIALDPSRRRHHRRGKRNRHRKRATSEEVLKIGNICAESSNGTLEECSKYEMQQPKELITPNKFEIDKSGSSKSKAGESKHVKGKKDNLSKNFISGEVGKYRHRYHQQKNIKKLYYSSRANNLNRNGGISNRKPMLILRPNRGPLMNAPRNSTQFIINDHEEGGDEEIQDPSRYQESYLSTITGRSNRTPKTNWTDNFQPSPDDDTFWADYLERDFQTVYESAHREDVANWDRTKLVEEITN